MPMTDLADRLYEQVLVLRCQAGSQEAFTEIVERYQPRLEYFVRKILAGKPGAEDILQDVWLDVLRGISRLSQPCALAAWLFRIARDRTLRELRKRRLPLYCVEPIDGTELA